MSEVNKPIAIGGDHAGFTYKQQLIDHLLEQGHQVVDFGTFDEQSTDYPDYVHPLARAIEAGAHDFGILICGSGNGVCMTANKHEGIRAAFAWNEELAELARRHNNANTICFGSRFLTIEAVKSMTDRFLATDFEGGRHQRRVGKISC